MHIKYKQLYIDERAAHKKTKEDRDSYQEFCERGTANYNEKCQELEAIKKNHEQSLVNFQTSYQAQLADKDKVIAGLHEVILKLSTTLEQITEEKQ
jgi:hypothetical protein